MRQAYIGIDACFAKGKRLPISICTWRGGRLLPEPLRRLDVEPPRGHGNAATLNREIVRRFGLEAKDYIVAACEALNVEPHRIAIDAPSAPRSETSARRAAERAMDTAGISCFTTPTAAEFAAIQAKARNHLESGGAENRLPHANQLWMLVGFELFNALASLADCIEVFPQAIVRALGAGTVHKSKVGAVEEQLLAAARYTGWPGGGEDEIRFEDIAWAPGHDRLDAYLSAWVAALGPADRVALGEPPGDVIWIPKLPDQKSFTPDRSTLRRVEVLEVKDAKRRQQPRKCPACDFQFKQWPAGWDSHAAHKCAGLMGQNAEARKQEYRERFSHLF